jgi:gluconate 2-dehydrogenase gamma chain
MSRATVTRRSALRILGAGAGSVAVLPWLSEEGAAAFAEIQKKGAAPSLKVLTAAQYATLVALTEAIIPADERSPGAKEARVADYIDLLLSEADDELRREWTDGIAALDADAVAREGVPFAKLDPQQTWTMLLDASRDEKVREPRPAATEADASQKQRPADVSAAEKPADAALNAPSGHRKTPVQRFFITVKQATIHGYYSSEIGIHKELRSKGNQTLAEFVGCHTVDGKDCPHCGQKAQV